jgi:hypothetical protein
LPSAAFKKGEIFKNLTNSNEIKYSGDNAYFESDNVLVRQTALIAIFAYIQELDGIERVELSDKIEEFKKVDISKIVKQDIEAADYYEIVRLFNGEPKPCSAP